MSQRVLPSAPRRHAVGPAACAAAALLAPVTAAAGIVFREVQVTEQAAPAATIRLVRQVLSEGENCKILHEESTDPLAPAGSYILVNTHDAFIVDPTRATVSPVDATDMVPAVTGDERPRRATVSGVVLERQFEGVGPALLGLATRHFVYRLTYEVVRPADAGAPVAVRHEERHEFFVAPWSAELQPPETWREWRVAEDAGVGAERREVRAALESLHDLGFMLKHAIERRVAGADPAEGAATERVSREVTALSRQELDARVFARPEGFAPAEFLAPAPDDADAAGPADPGGAITAGRAPPAGT